MSKYTTVNIDIETAARFKVYCAQKRRNQKDVLSYILKKAIQEDLYSPEESLQESKTGLEV